MAEITIHSTDDGMADEAMIAFVEAGGSADLSDWMHRYPEYSSDFAHIAAERWAGVPYGNGDTGGVSAIAETSVARFKAMGRNLAVERRTAAAPSTPIMSLVAAAKERGLDADTLAERIRVPYGLFFKLHRRLIAPDSIPRAVVARLSEAIGRTADEVAAYFRMPPTLALGASYRADSAPSASQQESFAAALDRDPDTTVEQKSYYSVADPDSVQA